MRSLPRERCALRRGLHRAPALNSASQPGSTAKICIEFARQSTGKPTLESSTTSYGSITAREGNVAMRESCKKFVSCNFPFRGASAAGIIGHPIQRAQRQSHSRKICKDPKIPLLMFHSTLTDIFPASLFTRLRFGSFAALSNFRLSSNRIPLYRPTTPRPKQPNPHTRLRTWRG